MIKKSYRNYASKSVRRAKMFKLIEGIIPRNIDGIYFIVNRYEYRYYTNFKLMAINSVGYVILLYLQNHEWCVAEELVNHIKYVFKDSMPDDEKVFSDVYSFCKKAVQMGYMKEKSNEKE